MTVSLLVVNYRSAELARAAVASARAAASDPLEVVVVDNSCDDAEASTLREFADEVIVSPTNRGYAGAINDGRRACHGDAIVVSNPDVVFAADSIDALVEPLRGRTAVAGPALFWDDAHEWRLPPGDRNSGLEKLGEALASRSRAWFTQRDRRRIRRRIAFWSLRETTDVETLSGAVMAIRAADFDALGGFDERFRLYFEETDYLRRVRASRRRIAYVPSARCRHIYNQSAGRDASAAAARYAESELRYLEKWNGPFAARLLKDIERPVAVPHFARMEGPFALDREDVVVEASPLATFATAAGHIPHSPLVELPPEILASIGDSPLYLRVVTRNGETLVQYVRYGS